MGIRQLPECDIPPARPEDGRSKTSVIRSGLLSLAMPFSFKEISDIVQTVVAALAHDMPLQDLDGRSTAIDADFVIKNLDFAEPEIAAETAKLADSSDIGPTMMRALECVSAVLDHAADWIGHRDRLPEGKLFAGSELPQRLKDRGSDRWIELFGRDLAARYVARIFCVDGAQPSCRTTVLESQPILVAGGTSVQEESWLFATSCPDWLRIG